MHITVKKREGESTSAFLYRFNKRVKQSGILKEAKKRRFKARPPNRQKRRNAALYRRARAAEIALAKKRHGGHK